jgi:heme ABC exporter ATP-binding subunit CcmA
MIQLRADNIAKRFRNRVLFEGVSLEIVNGERIAVTGSNGSGKSTLLKILGGLLRPSIGVVSLDKDGVRVDGELHSLEFGYVAPASNVHSAMSGIENIRFLQSFYSGAQERPEELLERVGLADASDRTVGEYSSGMLQRIKLACALVGDPTVLLLDEPFSNLDSKGIAVVEDSIREHCDRGRPVVIATNVQAEADKCDRIISIEDFKRVADSTPVS